MIGRDDIELGDEIADFPRRPRTGTVVSVRLSLPEAAALHALAERRGTTLSSVARDAIAAYLERAPLDDPAVPPMTVITSAPAAFTAWITRTLPVARTYGSRIQPSFIRQRPID
jgi:hypothetical protein